MSRVAWWRVLPICQVTLFIALIAVGQMKQLAHQAALDVGLAKPEWDLIGSPPTSGDPYTDAALAINFPALVAGSLIQSLIGPRGIPYYVIVGIGVVFCWGILGLWLDRHIERSHLPGYVPRQSHPLVAWLGFGGCAYLAGEGMSGAFLGYSAFSLSYMLMSLWPLAGAAYFGIKIQRLRSAHRPPLPSIIRTP